MSTDFGAPLGLTGRAAYRIGWSLAWLVSKIWFRFRVVHKERFPVSGAFVLAPIHRSYIDTPLGAVSTVRRMRFLAKDSVWNSRIGGQLATLVGGFPVARERADRAALRACQAVIEQGDPVVMFPEGTRQHGPVLEATKMHGGPAFVAARSGVPIVPMGIAGSDRAMPHGARWIRPTRVVVVVGKPVYPPVYEGQVPRRLVDDLTEELRVAIQEAFDEARVLVNGATSVISG